MPIIGYNKVPDDLRLGNDAFVSKEFPTDSKTVANQITQQGEFKVTKSYPAKAKDYQVPAAGQFNAIKTDYNQAAITYTPGCLKGHAVKQTTSPLAFLFANPALFLKWVQAQAVEVKMEVDTHRLIEAREKYWTEIKKAFNHELERINLQRQAALEQYKPQ